MTLQALYLHAGAQLAPDGIPLHFGDTKAEYQAALRHAVLLDRRHEGRIEMRGAGRLDLLNRMSTNNFATMQPGQGLATIFTNPNARLIDRIEVFNRSAEALLLLAGPGRGPAVQDYLQRNIFFKDDVQLKDLLPATHQFALHGPQAAAVVAALFPQALPLGEYQGVDAEFEGERVFVARSKPYSGGHWLLVSPQDKAAALWQALMTAGQPHGLRPAGGLTFNTLRIRAGRPGVGFELTGEYIPLELGLWDEISFNKICYTGQEIIARMESRGKLARTLVSLQLGGFLPAPAALFHEGRPVGTLTSSVQAPDGEIFAMGVVKTAVAAAGTALHVGQAEGEKAVISALLGVQPLTG